MYGDRWRLIEAEFQASVIALRAAELAFTGAVVEKRRQLCETFASGDDTAGDEAGTVVALPFSRTKGAMDRLEQDLHQAEGLDEAHRVVVAAQARFSAAAEQLVQARVDTPALARAKVLALMQLQHRAWEQSLPDFAVSLEHRLPPEDRLPTIGYLDMLNSPDGLRSVLHSLLADLNIMTPSEPVRRTG